MHDHIFFFMFKLLIVNQFNSLDVRIKAVKILVQFFKTLLHTMLSFIHVITTTVFHMKLN